MPTAPYSRSDLDLTKIDWRRVDATPDAEIARQASEDPDSAPLFTAAEILSAGRRIEPEGIDDVRALRTRLGLSQEAFAARFGFSVDAIRQYREPPPRSDRPRPHPAKGNRQRARCRHPCAGRPAVAGMTGHSAGADRIVVLQTDLLRPPHCP